MEYKYLFLDLDFHLQIHADYLLTMNCCSYSPTQPFQSISLFQFESDVIFVPVSFLSLSASVLLQITAYQNRPCDQVFPSSSAIPRRAYQSPPTFNTTSSS